MAPPRASSSPSGFPARAAGSPCTPAPTTCSCTWPGCAGTPTTPRATDAIRAFATAYVNWTAHPVVADMHTLAAASLGQARSARQLAAAGAAGDYELRRGGIANSGTVEAIAPRSGSPGQYVVV